MAGYIGKISAVVTANTSDLSRKLAGAKEDVDTFANRMVRSFNSASQAAEKSFAGLFTPLQRLQRQFTGRELFNLGEDAAQIRRLNREVEQLTLASRQLAAPLAAAAKQFDALSLGTQRGFSDTLSDAQAALLKVKDSVTLVGDAGAAGFASISKQVQSTIVSINQLAEATKRVRALPTGNELTFSDPRLAGRLAAAQSAGEQAMSLAPEQIAANPQIAGLVRQINRVSELSVEASARLKNAIASGLDTQPAQIELVRLGGVLDGLIGRLNRNYQLIIDTSSSVRGVDELKKSVDFVLSNKKLQGQGGLGLFGSQVGTDAERAIAEAKKVDAQFRALPEAAREGLSGLAGIAARITDEVDRTGTGAQNLLNVLNRVKAGIAEATRTPSGSTALIVRPPEVPPETRRAIANSSLNVLQDISDPVGLTPLPANPRTAVLGNLGAELTQLQTKIAGLSDPLTAQLGPDVDRLLNKFRLLARDGVGFVGEEFERVRAQASALLSVLNSRGDIAKNFLGQSGGAGVGGLSLGVDTKQLEQIGSRIEFVQKAIVRLGDQARGPVLAAMEALRKKAFELFQSGEFNTDKGRAELRALEKDLIRTAAAATGVSEKDFTKAFNAVGRGGDIGRRGFDKLGLAAQQAAFILDDFFSVTGGLDQRIRAIGNNVSQLGFLLGGTFGLFAGVVASIGAQIAVAYLELANGGAKAEDRTRSLNDALSRQKSLAEGIAEAFKSVAQSIEQSGFTKRTREIREQGRLLDDLRKKNAEQARERAVGLDVNVVRERAVQASLQRRIESSDSAGERVRLTRELQQSRERERAAADAAAARRPPTPTEVGQRIAQVAVRQAEADQTRLLRPATFTAPLVDFLFGAPLLGVRPFGRGRDLNERFNNEEVRARAEEFARVTGDSIGAVSDPREQVRLLRLAIDAEINRISTQSVDRGVFAPITDTIFGTNRRADENIRELQDLANQLEKDIITGALNRISEESFGSILSAGETIASGLESVASIIGGGGSLVEVELERLSARLLAAQKQLNDANEAGDVGLAEAAQQQIDAIRAEAQQRSSVAQSLVTFAQALDRVSGQLITTVAQEARTAEEQARREMNRTAGLAEAGLGRPEDAEFAQRQFTLRQEEARRVARDAEEAQRQNLEARDRFEADARGGQLGQDAQQLIRQRDVADQILRGEIAVSNEQRVAAQRNREAADRQLGILFEDSPAGRAAAARANELDRRAAAENQALDDIERGRALAVTPAQQAGRELGDSFRQLQAAFDNLAIDQQQLNEARGRLLEDTARQQAPTIIGLRDAVANAVLQGPSRAALNVTDVSTVEGARELSRLLRGDDAARTQAELVTLQRESRDLLQVIADANRENADVAN